MDDETAFVGREFQFLVYETGGFLGAPVYPESDDPAIPAIIE